jgi:hypothetical protein
MVIGGIDQWTDPAFEDSRKSAGNGSPDANPRLHRHPLH